MSNNGQPSSAFGKVIAQFDPSYTEPRTEPDQTIVTPIFVSVLYLFLVVLSFIVSS